MIGVRIAASAASFIGAIWALLALVYGGGSNNLWTDFGTGVCVAAVGLLTWYATGWWEDR